MKKILFLILVITGICSAQNDSIAPGRMSLPVNLAARDINFNPLKTEIDYTMLAGLGGIYLGSGIAVHIYQRNAWWKDQRRSFHFVNDNTYALEIDKFGHFYAGNLLTHAFSAALEAGNIQAEESAIWGSVASFMFELYVEIEDGYGPNWGFSPGDAIGDFTGAAYALGQYYLPVLKNFQPRFSYLPSRDMKEGYHKGNMIDDYNGQKYWISIRMKELLPKPIDKYWPSFLMLSVGMGVKDLVGYYDQGKFIESVDRRKREFYIALDLDAEQIPLYGKGWQFVKNTLNYFHFPLPGIRISPDAAFFIFCF